MSRSTLYLLIGVLVVLAILWFIGVRIDVNVT